jgi:hypothetical protein
MTNDEKLAAGAKIIRQFEAKGLAPSKDNTTEDEWDKLFVAASVMYFMTKAKGDEGVSVADLTDDGLTVIRELERHGITMSKRPPAA